jgi:eukaryotic-like serine/threonine-protein kinase
MVEQDLSVDVDAAPAARDAIESQSKRLGDYLVPREIGRDGMGVVYEAEQVSLGRRVALKVLPHHVAHDTKALERFRREAKSAARLHHTNIVPVFEVGQDGETAYYAMQFIQGQGLDQIIDELGRLRDHGRNGAEVSPGPTVTAASTDPGEPTLSRVAGLLLTGRLAAAAAMPFPGDTFAPAGPAATEELDPDKNVPLGSAVASPDGLDLHAPPRLPASAVLPGGAEITTTALSGRRLPFFRSVGQIGRQAAQGLAYANSRRVIHRDIKPSNLLLDHAGVVWITDFGLAKGEDEGLSQSGDILGTLRYMAPERFRGEGDARADIYGLGLTLYELLTLRPAFDTSDRLTLIERIKTEEPARPRSLDGRIPRDLETIVLKAIDKDPRARYQSAEAMGGDLGRFLADEPIRARQISLAERYWRWAQRNREIAVLGAVLSVVLVLATVGALLVARRFARAAQEERSLRHDVEKAREVARRQGEEAIAARDEANARERSERWERYRSNIAEASAAQQLQNSSTGERALEAAPKEYRNWEWRHLHSLLDGASLVLPVPEIAGQRLRISPDAQQIAVGSTRGEVHLFDAATGRPGPVLRGNAGRVAVPQELVCTLEYSPDSRQLASGATDGTIRVWDPATGRQQLVLRGEWLPRPRYSSDGKRIASNEVSIEAKRSRCRLWDATTGQAIAFLGEGLESWSVVAFSPDGKRVVAAAGEFVRMYDADTGRQLSVLGPRASQIDKILFSPDGKHFVVTQSDGTTRGWLRDGDTGKVVADLAMSGARAVAFSADGSRLATSDRYPDNYVRLWETSSGKLIRAMSGHTNEVFHLAFSPDGKRLASASLDQTGRLWDGETGREIMVLRGHTGAIRGGATFGLGGTRLVTASDDHTLRLWDAGSGDLITVLRGHGGIVWEPAFTPDGARLISPSDDGTVRVWDMKLAERNGVLRGHTGFVYDVAFRPDGREVASAAWDRTVRLWDPDTGRQTGLLRHDTEVNTAVARGIESDFMSAVAYSPDGGRVATANRDLGVALWKAANAEREHTWPGSTGTWNLDGRVAFSPDGTLVAAGSLAGPVRLWEVATKERVAELSGHEGGSGEVAFAPDGATLASVGLDGTIRLWDVATRKAVAVLRGHTAMLTRVAYSPDGGLLASGAEDSTVRLWDSRTRAALATINVGSIVYGVAFSPDGTRLALGCADTTIGLIDVATRQEVAGLRGHTAYVHAVAWSPDGTRLISGSGDYTVRVWDSLSIQARARASQGKATR